jgi:hypothetical protein
MAASDHRFMWKLFQQIAFVSPNDGGVASNILPAICGVWTMPRAWFDPSEAALPTPAHSACG